MSDDLKDQDLKKEDAPLEEGKIELTPEELTAVSKGWKPKEKWVEDGGTEEDWKPAKVFNEIGALKESLSEKEKETKKLNKVVILMKEHHLHVREAAVKEAVDALRAERKAALQKEDFGKAEDLRDQIDDLREKAAQPDATLPREVEQAIRQEAHDPDPEFFKFLDRNPWYKPGGKDEVSKKADALGYSYHLNNPDWSFREVIKQVEADVKKLYPEKFNRPNNPVNEPGSRNGVATPSTSSVKLSSEEKAVAKQFGMTEAEYAKELQSYRGR